jgi:hypothetical protein
MQDYMAENSYDEMTKLRALMSAPYQPVSGLYVISGDEGTSKNLNSFDELVEFLIDYVADYTQKFKVMNWSFFH